MDVDGLSLPDGQSLSAVNARRKRKLGSDDAQCAPSPSKRVRRARRGKEEQEVDVLEQMKRNARGGEAFDELRDLDEED